MTLEQAIKILRKEYKRAKAMKFIRNPTAWALHQTWKQADSDGRRSKWNG